MAAIGHKFVQQTTRQSETSTSFVTQLTLSNADITNTADYLVFCHAHVGGSNANQTFAFQLAQDGTAISHSLSAWEPARVTSTTRNFVNYDFFTVLRNIDGSKDLQFQMRTVTAGSTAYADGIVLGIIRLDADLTEDTGTGGDWLFNENTTATFMSTTYANFATDIITSANEDWLVMMNVRVDVNDPGVSFDARMNRDDTDLTPGFRMEGERPAFEFRNFMMARAYTLTAGAHTFTLQARDDGLVRGVQNQHVRSAIFALRMDAFDKTVSAYDDALFGGNPNSVPDGAEQLSVSVTPATAGDYLIVSSGQVDVNFPSEDVAFFHREGAATYMPTDDNLITAQSVYSISDSSPLSAVSVPDGSIMTTAAHTITLRAYDPGASFILVPQASLAVISMELATTVGPVVLTPSSTKVPIVLPDVSITFGATTLTPDALAVPIVLPAPTLVLGTKTLTPDALAVPVALPDPTVSFGTKTLTPDALAVPVLLPNVTVQIGGSPTILNPDPVIVSIVLPAPTVSFGTKTLTPDALAVPILLPTPSVTLVKTLTPDALAVPILLPNVQVAIGDLTLTPDALAVPILLPDVTVAAGINYIFSGEDIIEIDTSKYRSGVLFRYAAVLRADAVGQSGRSRLFNITDSVAVSGSEVTYSTVATAEATLYISGTFDLTTADGGVHSGVKQYRPQHKADNVAERCTWHSSKLGVAS